jgi:Na+/proline symporter
VHIAAVAAPAGKFHLLDFGFSLTQSYTFWGGLIGGCFLTMASHGTEQLLVQRLLSARSERESRLALFSSWVVIFFQFTLFLLIGVVLFVQYRDAGRAAPAVADKIYPDFVWHNMPAGIAGLIMAAILAAAMSNLSAALNALASTSVMDFLQPLFPGHAETRYLLWSRFATIIWGGVLFGIGLLARHWGSVLEAGLSIASVLYGALLGVFLLGVLTKRPGPNAAIAGMLAGFAAAAFLHGRVAFTWYVLFGSAATFIVGYASGFFLDQRTNA